MHPDDYECPVDHGWAAEAGWSAEEVAAATGRTLEATTYFVPPDDNELAVKVQDVSNKTLRGACARLFVA